jgi:hypothetical protein
MNLIVYGYVRSYSYYISLTLDHGGDLGAIEVEQRLDIQVIRRQDDVEAGKFRGFFFFQKKTIELLSGCDDVGKSRCWKKLDIHDCNTIN